MKIVFVIVGFVFCCSCGDPDLLNFDKMGKPQGWEPTYSLLLARADFSIWDAFGESVSDSATLRKEENGELVMEYKCADIYTIGVDDIYSMKAEDMYFNGSFPINPSHFVGGQGTLQNPYYDTLHKPYRLEQLLPEVSIREATLSIKNMTFIVVNNANIGGMLTVICENLFSLETGEKIMIPLPLEPGRPSTVFSTTVPNLKAMLNGSDIVPLTFILKVTDITKKKDQNVLIDISTTGVEYKNVNLFLPSASISLPSRSVTPNIPLLNALSGDFEFTRPEMQIVARTKGMGADFRLKPMEFSVENEEETLRTNEVFEFVGESQNVTESDSRFIYNSMNSNICEFANLFSGSEVKHSNGMLYYGDKEMWLYAGGKLAFDLSLKIPLELSATKLVYYDTIRDLNLKDVDKVIEARLKFEGENGIPMELGISEVLLLDEDGILLDCVKNENTDVVFPAATATSTAKGSIEITFAKENLQNLAKSKQIVLKIFARSGQNESVTIKENSRLDLRLHLNARVDMGDVVFN